MTFPGLPVCISNSMTFPCFMTLRTLVHTSSYWQFLPLLSKHLGLLSWSWSCSKICLGHSLPEILHHLLLHKTTFNKVNRQMSIHQTRHKGVWGNETELLYVHLSHLIERYTFSTAVALNDAIRQIYHQIHARNWCLNKSEVWSLP